MIDSSGWQRPLSLPWHQGGLPAGPDRAAAGPAAQAQGLRLSIGPGPAGGTQGKYRLRDYSGYGITPACASGTLRYYDIIVSL